MRGKMKRLLAMLLCAALVLGCAVTASAAEGGGESSITIIQEVTDIGEKITSIKVDFANKVESVEGSKVTVTYKTSGADGSDPKEETVERPVAKAELAEDGMSAVLQLATGGMTEESSNTTYISYKVEVAGETIEVTPDTAKTEAPDVDKFEALTYTTPEYVRGEDTLTTMNARAFTPDKEAYPKPEKGYPLIVWLHGGGEQGADNRIQIAANDVPNWTEKASQDIFSGAYVLAPQNHANGGRGNGPAATMSVIEQFIAEKGDIDTDRVYVGGCSYGGMSTWAMIQSYPDFFAAAFPICGGPVGGLTAEQIEALKDMPIYMTTAAGDGTVRANGMIQAYNDLYEAGSREVHFTIFHHSESAGLEGLIQAIGHVLDHFSWMYVHDDYDAMGHDYDGVNYIDPAVDKEFTDLNGSTATMKDGVFTFNYTEGQGDEAQEKSIVMKGSIERPADIGYATFKTWLADQSKAKSGSITVVQDITDIGEKISGLKVSFPEKVDSLDGAKVTVTYKTSGSDGTEPRVESVEREITGKTLAGDGMSAEFKLATGGMTEEASNTKYISYKVEVGDVAVSTVAATKVESPDVDKFEAVTYTTPEHTNIMGQKSTAISARAFTPDKELYKKSEAGYPLIIWLHGIGEVGSDNRIQIAANDVPNWTSKETQDLFGGAYVLAPQNHANWGTGDAPAATKSLIDQFIEAKGDIDADRIYIGGCSYGGMSTWSMIRSYPDFFAAAFPICGGPVGGLSETDIENLKDLPIYITTAAGDNTVRADGMIKAYNDLYEAGSKNLHITLFEHVDSQGLDGLVAAIGHVLDHFSWIYAHNDYDAKGDDYDGKNYMDPAVDKEYTDLNGATAVMKDGKLTYSYTDKEELKSITLNGSNERPEDAGYATFKEWIADQVKGKEAPAFADVPVGEWYTGAVRYVCRKGMMKGVGEDAFKPNDITTRAQLVAILYRLEENPVTPRSISFSDVSADDWFKAEVDWASTNGIVEGSDGKFYPNARLTRQDFVTILYRYAKFKGYDTESTAALDKFSDVDSVSSYAKAPMQWAVENGLINGVSGKLDPKGTSVRAQTAAILRRFCEGVK